RVEKGGEIFSQWPALKTMGELPRAPRAAIDALTTFFRYSANLARLGRARHHVACVVKSADLVAPAFQGGLSYDLSALALLMREWSTDTLLTEQTLATFLLTENLNDLHPLLVNNARAMHVKIPLPSAADLTAALALMKESCPSALGDGQDGRLEVLAHQLC